MLLSEDKIMSRDDSEVKAILFCEFHPTHGPKIICQDPPNGFDSKEFASLSAYVIPKTGLQGQLMTVNSLGKKVIGFPVALVDSRFERNRYIFNLCFVCEASKRTVQYEPLVRKLARYLTQLEYECRFLTQMNPESMILMLEQIRHQLNESNSCSYTVTDSTRIHLKVVNVHRDPRDVLDHEVPVLSQQIEPSEWDLTTQQLLPYIDGFRHIAKISTDASVEVSLVKACIQNMIYYGLVSLIPIFSYASSYVATSKLPELLYNQPLQSKCRESVRLSTIEPHNSAPTLNAIFALYCCFRAPLTVRDVGTLCNPEGLGIDIRSIVKFGLLHGLLRKLDYYPVLTGKEPTEITRQRSPYNLFDGNHAYDAICTKSKVKSYRDLNDYVKKHRGVIVIKK